MKTKVLVVEDSLTCLKFFQVMIDNKSQELFDYAYVNNLKDALQEVKNNQYGLILLDLLLPDSQSDETIETVTTEIKNTPIIVISSIGDEQTMQYAFACGVEDFLVKNQFNLETFMHVATQAVNRFVAKTGNDTEEKIKKLMENLAKLNDFLA